MHGPEGALPAGGLGGARGRERARVRRADREVAEGDAQRQVAQPLLQRRAERALVVAVDHHERRLARAAHVVVGPERRQRGGAEVGQRPVERVEEEVRARQVARRLGLVAPAHDRVGPADDERPLREALGMEHPERAARLALGLEVRELLDRDAEALLERALRPDRVARDAVQRRAARLELVEHLVVEAQLVGADRRERERIEDEDGGAALEAGARERFAPEGGQRELRSGLTGGDDGHVPRARLSGAGRARGSASDTPPGPSSGGS